MIVYTLSLQYWGANNMSGNSLRNDLKELKSSNAFKKALHTHVQALIPWLICKVILHLIYFQLCKEITGNHKKRKLKTAGCVSFCLNYNIHIPVTLFIVITRLCTMNEGWQ